MPSPIAHTAIAYVIFSLYQPGIAQKGRRRTGGVPRALILMMILSMLPDLDSVGGILMGDLRHYHNHWTHSLVIGLGVALVIGGLVWSLRRSGFARWFMIALLCFELHIVMDYFTFGSGVMVFWPFSQERFRSPVPLFYGLHWSDGWLSIRHIITIVTELGFIALISIIVYVVCDREWYLWPFKKN